MHVLELLGLVDMGKYSTRHGVGVVYTLRCINHMMEWRGKASGEVVDDSTVDEFTGDGLFNKVKGKENVALVGFTTDGDVFGGSPASL